MDDEWAEAINDTLDTDLAVAEPLNEEEAPDEKPDEKPEPENGEAGEESSEGKEGDKGGEESPEGEGVGDAEGGAKPTEKPVPPTPPVEKEPEEKFATKDAIKEAIRELESESRTSNTEREVAKKNVLDAFYPEGIDRQLRDSDGDPITGIDDLTKLVNPKTQDYFTEEEAATWLLEKQQKLNKEIEQLEDYAAEIVDTNMSLKDGAARVEELYGELLKAMPDVAEQVLDAYQKTLVKDPKTEIVIKAPVDVVEFYNIALSGYKKMAEQMKGKAEADAIAAKKEAEEKAKLAQSERGDLVPKGSSELPLGEEDQGWDTAMDQYYNNKKVGAK